MKKCEDCDHWLDLRSPGDPPGTHPPDEHGECHRYPPNMYLIKDRSRYICIWPKTSWGSFCGEFVPK